MFHRFCKYFIQLIFSPANGWEDFQRDWDEHSDWDGHTFSGVYRRCFLPIALVCALSAFFRLIYGVPGGWLEALQHAIITFVSLFLSSQFANYVLLTYMPRFLHTDHPAEYAPRWGMLVIVSLTLLGLIGVLENLVKENTPDILLLAACRSTACLSSGKALASAESASRKWGCTCC